MHKARIVHCGIYRAEADRAYIVHGQTELRVIEEVEELCAEVQTHLSVRQHKLLDNGKVGVDEIGAYDRDAI